MTDQKRKGLTRRSMLQSTIAGAGAAWAGISFGPKAFAAAHGEEPKVNFYNWDTYIGETTLSDFNDLTGIEANMSLFADNDELFAKLREGNPGFDVIVPSDTYVARMIAADMLEPLDYALLPNSKNIAPAFRDAAYDPGHKHSVNYMWGTMGLGVRKSKTPDGVTSWGDIFESDKYAGRIAILSESSAMIGMASMYLGTGMNPDTSEKINAAVDLLIKQKSAFKTIAEDNGQDLLLSGEVDITIEWSGDIGQVMLEDDDIDYVIPKEGSLIWADNLCIPKDAPHPMNAHKFINYILDPQVGALIADYIQYATPNQAARALLNDSYNKNPSVFPPEEVLAKCEWQRYPGEEIARIRDEAWTRFLAA
ncbi:MAG: spermidine/putrescine ABC transporter substrate-binding protein [Rhodospirillaceae bacterium]|jgi:spermidine/putrescine transport system substrate-binding protein|uniref:ABC transporter substrate-binding protein n=1 Tax=unclassified Hwanghaeella TaxID=2605944 RepID=UPI000C6559BE|nr:spermidine/putrescine ABC transporter substrate-binding protein [Rhodospirillales bacterium]MAX48851.1 spermidine/putrescine ABC transporter substrate-binding protein [Rhodospirillaceae bacterium]|tara:strand:+ start:1771 stop:2865 length:1095 start_codon:yes stop_codon:yes gene_type:complete